MRADTTTPRPAVHSGNNFNLIRLIAATQVLLVHSMNHNGVGGWGADLLKATPGVPVFYFISGYLISASYLRTSRFGLWNFFRNRVLRIFPALIVCVALATSMVAATGYLASQTFGIGHFLLWVVGQMTIVQFYNPDFMRGFGVGVLNGALWTITVELQFYLLTPILVWLYHRSKPATLILFAVSIVSNVYLGWFGGERNMLEKLFSVTFLPWVFMFMLGMHLAVSERARALLGRLWLLPLLAAYPISMVLIGGYAANAQNSINPISFALLAALIFKLAHYRIGVARPLQDVINRNDVSYGVYLYHMPIINLMLFLGASLAVALPTIIAATILCALGSWFLVERPALRRKAAPAAAPASAKS